MTTKLIHMFHKGLDMAVDLVRAPKIRIEPGEF